GRDREKSRSRSIIGGDRTGGSSFGTSTKTFARPVDGRRGFRRADSVLSTEYPVPSTQFTVLGIGTGYGAEYRVLGYRVLSTDPASPSPGGGLCQLELLAGRRDADVREAH